MESPWRQGDGRRRSRHRAVRGGHHRHEPAGPAGLPHRRGRARCRPVQRHDQGQHLSLHAVRRAPGRLSHDGDDRTARGDRAGPDAEQGRPGDLLDGSGGDRPARRQERRSLLRVPRRRPAAGPPERPVAEPDLHAERPSRPGDDHADLQRPHLLGGRVPLPSAGSAGPRRGGHRDVARRRGPRRRGARATHDAVLGGRDPAARSRGRTVRSRRGHPPARRNRAGHRAGGPGRPRSADSGAAK